MLAKQRMAEMRLPSRASHYVRSEHGTPVPKYITLGSPPVIFVCQGVPRCGSVGAVAFYTSSHSPAQHVALKCIGVHPHHMEAYVNVLAMRYLSLYSQELPVCPAVLGCCEYAVDQQRCVAVCMTRQGPDLFDYTAAPCDGQPVKRLGCVVRVLARLSGRLATLHEAGMIYGDVKPENAVLCSASDAVWIDFDQARFAPHAPDATLTEEQRWALRVGVGTGVGTVGYTSPTRMAQVQRQGVPPELSASVSDDMHAFGCTIACTCTGLTSPFASQPCADDGDVRARLSRMHADVMAGERWQSLAWRQVSGAVWGDVVECVVLCLSGAPASSVSDRLAAAATQLEPR